MNFNINEAVHVLYLFILTLYFFFKANVWRDFSLARFVPVVKVKKALLKVFFRIKPFRENEKKIKLIFIQK